MVSIRDNDGLWETRFGYLPKMRIHIENKVFHVCFGLKL